MSDPKEQQKTQDEPNAEDLTVPDQQAQDVRGGEVSMTFKSTQVEYKPQK